MAKKNKAKNRDTPANHALTRMVHVRLKLEEDLHTGSGTGTMEIDSLQARNERGRPCVPREHYKGLLALAAKRLEDQGHLGKGMKDELFGAEGRQPGGLVIVPTLRADEDIPTLLWTEVARVPGRRDALDKSLRTIEYVPAASTLKGTFRFRRPPKDHQIDALRQCIRQVKRLGHARTRGSGAVCLIAEPEVEAVPYPGKASIKKDTRRMRLILKSEEAVCIPLTGMPGNIIRSHSFIPGTALNGAISAWGEAHGVKTPFYCSGLAVSCAYPLPGGFDPAKECNPDWLRVLPMPLNQYRTKSQGNPEETDWPHWAPGYQSSPDADQGYFDRLSEDKKPGKRPKGHQYLYSDDAGASWLAYSVPLGIQMRNRRGDPAEVERKEDTDLFSVQAIAAGSYFLCDITGPNRVIGEFAESHGPLFSGDGKACITVGRGAAPVTVVKRSYSRDISPPVENQRLGNTLQITLTSGLIATAPANLGQHTRWSLATLKDLLPDQAAEIQAVSANCVAETPVSDTEYVGSFNAASGLPRLPVTAIRRGSVLRLSVPDQEAPKTALKKLRDILDQRARSGRWLGERVQEGFGRYVLHCEAEPFGQIREGSGSSGPEGAAPLPRIEQLARLARGQERIAKSDAYKIIGILAPWHRSADFDEAVKQAQKEYERQAKDEKQKHLFGQLLDRYWSIGHCTVEEWMQWIKMVILDDE